jgi:tripartite-type tricarboxylate transporter receptor subunit TctC
MKIPVSTAQLCYLSAFALAVGCISPVQAAGTYPDHPIRMIVPAAPGGLLDVTTRLVARRMSEELGVSIIVDNRPGGETLVGTQVVKNAQPDGYTVLSQANNMTARPAFYKDPGYDLMKDFTPVGPMIRAPLVMLVPSSGPKTFGEWVAQARAQPNKIAFASGGIGTPQYVAAALLQHDARLSLLHVPYSGNGAAMPDVMGGRVNMIFDGYGSCAGYIKSQKLHPLGVTSGNRLADLPSVPTIAEEGYPNYNYFLWLGLFAPAGTSPETVQRLSDALHKALNNKDLAERFHTEGSEPMMMTPAEFGNFLNQDLSQMSQLVKEAGIQKH